MAHKKGQGSSRNGRDSNAQRLGFKAFGGQLVPGGTISSMRAKSSRTLGTSTMASCPTSWRSASTSIACRWPMCRSAVPTGTVDLSTMTLKPVMWRPMLRAAASSRGSPPP